MSVLGRTKKSHDNLLEACYGYTGKDGGLYFCEFKGRLANIYKEDKELILRKTSREGLKKWSDAYIKSKGGEPGVRRVGKRPAKRAKPVRVGSAQKVASKKSKSPTRKSKSASKSPSRTRAGSPKRVKSPSKLNQKEKDLCKCIGRKQSAGVKSPAKTCKKELNHKGTASHCKGYLKKGRAELTKSEIEGLKKFLSK